MKIKPGLSSYISHPESAGPSLQVLINFMKEEIPQEMWEHTPIWLKATAGLRLLTSSESAKILHSVRTMLSSKEVPFIFNSAMATIMPGNEEGAYSWIAYNYLKKLIGPKRQKRGTGQKNSNLMGETEPYTVVDMGGASVQVTAMALTPRDEESIPKESKMTFVIGIMNMYF